MVAVYFVCAIELHFVALQSQPARHKLRLCFARPLLKMPLDW